LRKGSKLKKKNTPRFLFDLFSIKLPLYNISRNPILREMQRKAADESQHGPIGLYYILIFIILILMFLHISVVENKVKS